jgi:hypothetical protein
MTNQPPNAQGPSDPQSDRLIISSDDLQSAQVEDSVQRMKDAQQVPLVRQVGTAPTGSASGTKAGFAKDLGIMAAAGLVAGIVIWGWFKITDPLFENQDSATAANLFFSVSLAVFIGVILCSADAFLNGGIAKVGRALLIAVPAALVIGLVLGAIANAIYSSAQESIVNTCIGLADESLPRDQVIEQFFACKASRNHIWRGIAWALCGLGAGLTVGVASLAWRRTVLTAVGGLVGGFLGGFLFDYMPGEAVAQILGFCLTGTLVACSMVLVEQAAKSYWIEVVSGGMAGKQFILYLDKVTIGAAPSAAVTLVKDPGIAGIHCVISRTGSGASIEASPGASLMVNGMSVMNTMLVDGATISLGNTVLRFRERSASGATIGEIRTS